MLLSSGKLLYRKIEPICSRDMNLDSRQSVRRRDEEEFPWALCEIAWRKKNDWRLDHVTLLSVHARSETDLRVTKWGDRIQLGTTT